MIRLTRLNSSEIIVNSDLIEFVELTPDTVVSLTTGEKIIVKESAEEIIEKILDFKRMIFGRDTPIRGPRLVQNGGDEPHQVEPTLRVLRKD